MSMKLMILGLLMETDRHPYDMRQAIKQRHWDYAFKLRDGSLYYAIDQLRESGLIEAAEVVAGENRPDKTIYRITAAGREQFMKLLYSQLELPAHPQHPMMMAMPFLRHGNQTAIAELAERQLEACRERIVQLEKTIRERGSYMPRSAQQMLLGMIRYGRAEEAWLAETLAEAKAGLYDEYKDEAGVWRCNGAPRSEP